MDKYEAAARALEALFAQYPPIRFYESNVPEYTNPPTRWRALALGILRERESYDDQALASIVYHRASDTGVPNELLRATIALALGVSF